MADGGYGSEGVVHPVSSYEVARMRAEELRREAEQAGQALSGRLGDGPAFVPPAVLGKPRPLARAERGLRFAEMWRRSVAVFGLWSGKQ